MQNQSQSLSRTLAFIRFCFLSVLFNDDGKKFSLRILDRPALMLQSYRVLHTLRTYISYIFKKITLFFIYSVTDHTELHTIYTLCSLCQRRRNVPQSAWFSTIFWKRRRERAIVVELKITIFFTVICRVVVSTMPFVQTLIETHLFENVL